MDETTFEQIVLAVLEWYKEDAIEFPAEAAVFKNTPMQDLSKYNTSLGRSIRNEFDLWKYPWEPQLVNGIDYSPNHPDEVSIRVLQEVWKRIQDN
ncbi:hypothetical protein DQT32_03735 [Salmonella enterica subsp. enterica serovar Braenderup]|nr:hypothetical protein [Salmonella enterica subsp. enterica serovar Braenderup]